MQFINFRISILFLSLFLGLYLTLPSISNSFEGKQINLGLDLQGGLYMRLGVKTEEAVINKIESIGSSIKYFCESNDILIDDLNIKDDTISFLILDNDELNSIDEMLSEMTNININKLDLNNYVITLTAQDIILTKNLAVTQAIDTIRNRLDQFGLSEPSVTKQGISDIVVELPGIKNQEEEQQARELISKTGKLELMAIDENNQDNVYSLSEQKIKELGSKKLISSSNSGQFYLVKSIPILTGKQVSNASVAFNEANQPIISFSLDSLGSKIFGDFTANNIGNRLAVVLDGKVYSAPSINERIGGGHGQISGDFTIQEAGNVVIALKSGSLPASIIMLEKRSVGPSLGADSIKTSMLALISGFVLVFLFMIIYYRNAGLISNFALITNIFIIIGVMTLFGATLTLPGMSGIVLTVGMAVDANVIINERIRELLKSGKSITISIKEGYNNAMTAILDANITTLLVAVILYAYGTGPIKGFAITISIGIFTSMLTALVGTYGIYQSLLPKITTDKNIKKWFGV